jgi:hypothetical protein
MVITLSWPIYLHLLWHIFPYFMAGYDTCIRVSKVPTFIQISFFPVKKFPIVESLFLKSLVVVVMNSLQSCFFTIFEITFYDTVMKRYDHPVSLYLDKDNTLYDTVEKHYDHRNHISQIGLSCTVHALQSSVKNKLCCPAPEICSCIHPSHQQQSIWGRCMSDINVCTITITGYRLWNVLWVLTLLSRCHNQP